MSNTLLTISQALQLVALVPAVFVIAFLALTTRHPRQIIITEFYFVSLCCSFLLPLLPLLQGGQPNEIYVGMLLLGESLAGGLSFLLIVQLLLGRIPPAIYWCILAIPLIGGSSLVYGTVVVDEICFAADMCIDSRSLKTLYGIVSSALIFLLLIVIFSRRELRIAPTDPHRTHKYWLVMALILLNLQLLFVDLAAVADYIRARDALFATTIIRISFVYLVLTSLFRVFDKVIEIDVSRIATITHQPKAVTAEDEAVADKIRELVEVRKIYREMGLSRENMAKELQVGGHYLSRIINQLFKKNFNEFINHYRIEEAKQRLREEKTSITVIAFEVGFNSIASFNRVFKEYTGLSPSEFRVKE